jgi:hypothetical protein
MTRKRLAFLVAAASLTGVSTAAADSTPVGPLPAGPVTTVSTERGSFVAVALPRQKASSGLVWRLARRVDPRVLRQVSEADVGSSVVVVFRALARGRSTVAFGLTRGESSSRAVRSITYRVQVT